MEREEEKGGEGRKGKEERVGRREGRREEREQRRGEGRRGGREGRRREERERGKRRGDSRGEERELVFLEGGETVSQRCSSDLVTRLLPWEHVAGGGREASQTLPSLL